MLLSAAAVYAQKKLDQSPTAAPASTETSQLVRVKLVDGSSITVDEAWESEQGIWYRRGGMSHLVSRDRVKGIERGAASKPKADLQVGKVVLVDDRDNDAKSRR